MFCSQCGKYNPETESKCVYCGSNDLVEKKNRVIVLKNNYAINKWIVERYKEFLNDNGSSYKINLEFSDSYKITNKVIIIGSEGFVNEMDSCLDVEKTKIINNKKKQK